MNWGPHTQAWPMPPMVLGLGQLMYRLKGGGTQYPWSSRVQPKRQDKEQRSQTAKPGPTPTITGRRTTGPHTVPGRWGQDDDPRNRSVPQREIRRSFLLAGNRSHTAHLLSLFALAARKLGAQVQLRGYVEAYRFIFTCPQASSAFSTTIPPNSYNSSGHF